MSFAFKHWLQKTPSAESNNSDCKWRKIEQSGNAVTGAENNLFHSISYTHNSFRTEEFSQCLTASLGFCIFFIQSNAFTDLFIVNKKYTVEPTVKKYIQNIWYIYAYIYHE